MAQPLEIIKVELVTDPLARGYAGMTDQQAADDLKVAYRVLTIPTVTGVQIGTQLDVSEYNALEAVTATDAQKAAAAMIRAMLPLSSIPTQSGFYRALLLATFAGGSTTRANLLAAFSRTISRAQELSELNGYPYFDPQSFHIANARALP